MALPSLTPSVHAPPFVKSQQFFFFSSPLLRMTHPCAAHAYSTVAEQEVRLKNCSGANECLP